jgi:uncharacterized protein involved in exopolysaccharide biosynthesis
MASEDYKRELLTTFFAQKRIIVITTLLIFSCAVLIAFFWPPTYASYGSVFVKVKKPLKSPESIEETQVYNSAITKEDLASEVEILLSPDVIERTITHLKEKNLYAVKKKSAVPLLDDIKNAIGYVKRLLSDRSKQKGMSKEVYEIKESLKTVIMPASNVIEISFYGNDPNYAVIFLDALLNQYIMHRMQIYYPEEAEEFFSQQKSGFSEGLEKKRKEWIELVEKNRTADPLKEIENNLTIKKELESQLNPLINTAIEKKHDLEYLDRALNNKDILFFSFLDKLSFTNLSVGLQPLYLEYGRILRTYKDSSDKAKPVEKQLQETLSELRAEVQAYRDNVAKDVESSNRKIAQMKSKIREIDDRNVELQKQHITTQKIAMEMNLIRGSYETFAKRKDEAISGALSPTSSYISILKKAFPSDGPIFPKKKIVIPLGLFVGFVTGCSLGFMRDYLDHTFKKISDVEKHIGLQVIFSIPDMSAPAKKQKQTKRSPIPATAVIIAAIALTGLAGGILLFYSQDEYSYRLNALMTEAEKTADRLLSSARDLFSDKKDEGRPFIENRENASASVSSQEDKAAGWSGALDDLCKNGIIFSSECYGNKEGYNQ